jgi:hypothetical protein
MVQEELMERLYGFTVLISLVRSSEIDDLWSLSLLLLDFSLSHPDLHVGLG